MKALFIGRFQPLHKGHLKILEKISKKYEKIIIVIGSAQYNHTKKNPFTAEERKKMIKQTLKEKNITNYEIYLIPDIHNPPKWVEHVNSIVPGYDIVVSNSEFNKDLFKKAGYKVMGTSLFNRDKYKGKEIRKRIKENKKWRHLVPKSTVKIIENIDAIKRIKE
ncbi:MAG: nicotinamide-nucleotide adenylyltransferase [Candidatus Thermoplasmatota archaeon]